MNDKEFELAMQARLMREWKGIPAGTPVIVTRDFNKGELRTKTCSPPFLLGGHTACIMVEDISGAYSLEKIRKA
jgi:hypothetical protein